MLSSTTTRLFGLHQTFCVLHAQLVSVKTVYQYYEWIFVLLLIVIVEVFSLTSTSHRLKTSLAVVLEDIFDLTSAISDTFALPS